MDYTSNRLKIFNLDHSAYADIDVPVTLEDGGEYTIGYVTNSLFDCDTATLEYAILPGTWRNTFYVYREDGTQLFQQDSTLAPYCFGCFSGSYDVRPVVNTSEGPKLFLSKATIEGLTPTVDVFSLCGELPGQVFEFDGFGDFVKLYPNPTRAELNFEIVPPTNTEALQITISGISGVELKKYTINSGQSTNRISVPDLPSGTYIYTLKASNREYQSGKFIISK